jgi:hypothetical protein
VLCADAFRISSSNSSSTTKSCVCPFTSISFLAGIISRSADSKLKLRLYVLLLRMPDQAHILIHVSRMADVNALQHFRITPSNTEEHGVMAIYWKSRFESPHIERNDITVTLLTCIRKASGSYLRLKANFPEFFVVFPCYLQARTVSRFRSITSFTIQPHVDAKGTVWDAGSREISKKEVTSPGLQTIPTEMDAISRNLFIRITKDYGETSVKCLTSNPYLLIMHDFKASFTAM